MRLPLGGGAYTARSLIAGAQRCVNLYSEAIPPEDKEPSPLVHYETAGLTLLGAAVSGAPCRGLYRSKLGALYGAWGTQVYRVDSAWAFHLLGTIAAGTSRVSMADNGVLLVIVDGTTSGYVVTIADDTWAAISDEAFYGADSVDYFGTYFLFNKPGLPQYYVSDANAVTFDSLYFANMAGYQDPIVAIVQQGGKFALIGQMHTEWWGFSGATDFPFQAIILANVEQGCAATYSVCKADNATFWISQNEQGKGVAVVSRGYAVDRISTHAIEAEWRTYSTISDAIGYTRQQDGHTFVVFAFPTAGKTWAYDLATKFWHEWSTNGGRHQSQHSAFVYGVNVCGDYASGNLYKIDPAAYTDNGLPIQRTRAFPHVVNGGKRVFYTQLLADMAVAPSSTLTPGLTLDWSDDRGATFTGTQINDLGAPGETLKSIQFQRLGMARDRVFRLSWSAPVETALMGAWIDVKASGS